MQRIRAINSDVEQRLKGLGVNYFEHIAAWTSSDVKRIGQGLGIPGRIDREQWVEQAQILAKGGETYYSRNRLTAQKASAAALEATAEKTSSGPQDAARSMSDAAPVVSESAAEKPETDSAPKSSQFSGVAAATHRRSHVGYYLAARGVHQLRQAVGYKSRLGETLSRFVRAFPTTVYIGSILAFTLLLLALAFFLGFSDDLRLTWPLLILLRLLALFPASELASSAVNLVVTLLLPPTCAPQARPLDRHPG